MQELITHISDDGVKYGHYNGYSFRINRSKVTVTKGNDLVKIWTQRGSTDDKLTSIVEFIDFRNSHTSFIN